MKNFLLSLLFLITIQTIHAQSYMGYFSDNYAGVQGVLFNPASIVDSRFRADINLFSTSSSLNNDFYGLSLFDLSKSSYDVSKEGKKSPSKNNGGIVYSDVMGPSFMFNIAPKHAIAIFTRARAIGNANSLNGELVAQIEEGLDDANDFNINVGDPNFVGHSWAEIGASYATVLLQNKQHFLKGGFTAKYLLGGINSYTNGNDIKTVFNQTNNPLTSTFGTTGTLTVGTSQDFITGNEDVKFDGSSNGFGFDFGFIYEWRPDYVSYDLSNAKAVDNNFKDQNKYKLRFGLSITDIGSIKYKNSKQEIYNFNNILTQAQIEATDDIEEFLDLYAPPTTTYSDRKVNLPSVMHLDADWNMHKKFYLNLNGNIGLTNKTGINSSSQANTLIITPRYETKWFSYYLPINWMEYSGFQMGSGLRFGPVFVGSSSVLTNWLSKESKAADVHFGVKIPLYQNKFKDTDNDGVLDKTDACPTVACPAENKGCPWPDTDGDTVLDKDDACSTVAGPVENKGCPWGDVDKDGVLDNVDKCPSVAGPAENNGCPWGDADNDNVFDKDDKCPTVAGPVENFGCPIVDAVVLKKLNEFSKSIVFDNGKATLKAGSTEGLDAMAVTMNEYETAKFTIDGHTDNVGKPASNLELSNNRAKTVKAYLVSKGVKEDRLTAQGFGADKPIASNKTAEGKSLNRRVEINLMK